MILNYGDRKKYCEESGEKRYIFEKALADGMTKQMMDDSYIFDITK